jgi:hypothetical protein
MVDITITKYILQHEITKASYILILMVFRKNIISLTRLGHPMSPNLDGMGMEHDSNLKLRQQK